MPRFWGQHSGSMSCKCFHINTHNLYLTLTFVTVGCIPSNVALVHLLIWPIVVLRRAAHT
jgi:hypothetical protein